MRTGLKRALSLVAIYAIALHTILWGAGLSYGVAIGPLPVICHSAAPGEPAQAPASDAPCDHCTLCSAMAPPAPEPGAEIARLQPAALLEVLRPAPTIAASGIAATPKLARGPPAVA
jgi:hypothetical protein